MNLALIIQRLIAETNETMAGWNGDRYPTKVAKRKALDRCNTAYEKMTQSIRNQILSIPHNIRNPKEVTVVSEELSAMYWCAPHYPHQWRKKHSELLGSTFPEQVEHIEFIVGLKKLVKKTLVENKEVVGG